MKVCILCLPFFLSTSLCAEFLSIENNTNAPIEIRLNKSVLDEPLTPNQQRQFDPKIIQTIELKYKNYPNLAFKTPKKLKTILNTIKTKNEDAVIHVEAGKLMGLNLNKTEFITPKERAEQIVLKILGINKSDIETEPFSKKVAAKILSIDPSSNATLAQKSFSTKIKTWNDNKISENKEVSNYYSSILLKALKTFENNFKFTVISNYRE